jgi:hypothetical protein
MLAGWVAVAALLGKTAAIPIISVAGWYNLRASFPACPLFAVIEGWPCYGCSLPAAVCAFLVAGFALDRFKRHADAISGKVGGVLTDIEAVGKGAWTAVHQAKPPGAGEAGQGDAGRGQDASAGPDVKGLLAHASSMAMGMVSSAGPTGRATLMQVRGCLQ